MSSREKDSSDFDLEQFIDLFDTAMSSDNPAVKRALKNLLMIATLVDSDIPVEHRVKGPLRRLVEDLKDISRRINRLESDRQYTVAPNTGAGGVGGGGFITTPYTVPMFPGPAVSPGTGTWAPGTGVGPNWPNGTIIGGGHTLTSSTAVDDQYLPERAEHIQLLNQKYQDILNRLEDK